jgi:arginyl-tRNA synthetase
MSAHSEITRAIEKIMRSVGYPDAIVLESPADAQHGDFSTNVAFVSAPALKKAPHDIAQLLVEKLKESHSDIIEKVEVAGAGFVNIWVLESALVESLNEFRKETIHIAPHPDLTEKKIMVEYAHPNTHKEMHIGHMRTLIVGEALARILTAAGAKVFRANYQGDIGPHVAKALWGIKKIMAERSVTLEKISHKGAAERAHFLGEGYVRGNQEYGTNETEIDVLNAALYAGKSPDQKLYETTREWSLAYYDELYQHFYTHFDRLFFESEMVECGTEIVKKNIGKFFIEDEGAVIFPGEKYGLHRRVFITKKGNPTYEGKEMCTAQKEYEAFPFERKIHVVANEQVGYFTVVFKALELIDPKKFKDKQEHVSMGMVNLTDRKMSSRTGDILTVDWLIDQVKARVRDLAKEREFKNVQTVEEVTIGAIKYSVLKVGTGTDVAFDIKTSVSTDGASGPYLQYTFARTQSVLKKAQSAGTHTDDGRTTKLEDEERALLVHLARFESVVHEAALMRSPNIMCTYLFELAQKFNVFYQKHPILKGEKVGFRLHLTRAVATTLKTGLDLLGIKSPDRM